MHKDIQKYNNALKGEDKAISKKLAEEIDKSLKKQKANFGTAAQFGLSKEIQSLDIPKEKLG